MDRRDFLKATMVSAGVAAGLRSLDGVAVAQTSTAPRTPAPSEADLLIARIDFSKPIRPWDGFGLNYVEACQTSDYAKEPQDYGGFSTMTEEDRKRIIDLAFGPDGLRPGVIKMFLDSFHQPKEPPAAKLDSLDIDLADYDNQATTRWMRHFVKSGLSLMRSQGLGFDVIVTMYGPPAWMTKQKFVRGRDLDPKYRIACAKYMAAWAKYLRDVEKIPVKYISLHNEGEDWSRWPIDGKSAGDAGHDYNLYWPAEQVVDFIKLVRRVLDHNGMPDVGVTPGEMTNWLRFQQWGYADAIADDPEAVKSLGLITSHGFHAGSFREPAIASRWAGDWRSAGSDILREKKPELHSWVTSTSWAKMRSAFVWELMQNIYSARNNAIIPWACIQRSSLWKKGDPNPGCAFRVADDGKVSVEPGYYYYKQACRAGQAGTQVCRTSINSTRCGVMAFASAGSKHPNAAVIINAGEGVRRMTVEVKGGKADYRVYRTSPKENDVSLGHLTLEAGRAVLEAPTDSVTCLVEQ